MHQNKVIWAGKVRAISCQFLRYLDTMALCLRNMYSVHVGSHVGCQHSPRPLHPTPPGLPTSAGAVFVAARPRPVGVAGAGEGAESGPGRAAVPVRARVRGARVSWARAPGKEAD